jgi:hypothetical protein
MVAPEPVGEQSTVTLREHLDLTTPGTEVLVAVAAVFLLVA